jgi:L-iditol 2-dehydrogenase
VKAIVFEKPFVLSMQDLEMPVPQSDEVLLRVLSAGICGSELHAYHGKHSGRMPPAVLGHEVTARVEPSITGSAVPAAGTRVVVLPQRVCGKCPFCCQGEPNLCENRVMLGTREWAGPYAEYFIAPASLLYSIPDAVTDDVGTLIEPLAVGIHAVKRSRTQLGENVLVIGSGAIGLMTIIAAQAAGARLVIATDIRSFNLQKAKEAGATHTMNPQMDDVADRVRSLTGGRGVDRAFVAVEAPGVIEQAVDSVRKRGSVTLIAMFTDLIPVNLQRAKAWEQEMIGSLTYDESDFEAALFLAGKKLSVLSGFITHRFDLEAAGSAFELADTRREDVVRIVFHPKSE